MRIRRATPADAEEVLALIEELADYEELAEQAVATVEQIRSHLAGPVITVSLVEEPDGAVAGMALWFATFSTFLGRTGIWLEDLFVRPAYRGRGYGRALLDHLRAETDGRVEWAVLNWNEPAIGFYRQLGARPQDEWTTYRWSPSDR